MESKRVLSLVAVLFVAALFIGCETTGPSNDEDTIKDDIGTGGKYNAYFNPTSDFSSGDEDSPPGAPVGPEAEATPPEGWYRFPTSITWDVWVHFSDANNAEVLVYWYIKGTMYVDRNFDGEWEPGTKYFDLTCTKEGKFVKTNDEWVLTHITPGEFRMTDGGQTVEVTSVKIESNTFNRTYSDPHEMIPLDDLPHFQPGDEVTVTVVATNSSTADWDPECFAFIHHDLVRDPMTNTATETYVREYTIGTEERVHHGCADVLDAQTLMTESGDDYNGSAWAMPYLVGEVPTI